MKHKLRPYRSAFRLRALLETQYRAAALGGLITNTFFGLVMALLYQALFDGGDPAFLRETITYVWLQQAFFRALFAPDGELSQLIMSGSIAYAMVRPVDQQLWWASRDLAAKLVSTFMRLVPMLAIQLLLPADLRMSLPASPVAFAQFALSLMLGFLCLTQIGSLCSAFTMITLDNKGVSGMLNLMLAALCGNVIPLTLFPEHLQALVRYQPFAQALDAPIRMYLHAQTGDEFAVSLAVQAVWLLALTALARALWRSHLKRLIVQGG